MIQSDAGHITIDGTEHTLIFEFAVIVKEMIEQHPELIIAVITKYTDNMEEILNHVDNKNLLLCYRKAERLKVILEDEHPNPHHGERED